MVTVRTAGGLRRVLGKEAAVSVEGDSLRDLIDQLAALFGAEVKAELLNEEGEIDYSHAFFARGERLYHAGDRIVDGDEVLIFPAIAGGRSIGGAYA